MKLHFHGHACWEVETSGHRVLIDPFLRENPLAKIGPEHFETLDAVLVTHGHFDHLADVAEIARRCDALVVSNFEIADYFSRQECRTHPMHIGGGREFPFGHVKWTIAHHGSTGPNGEALGNPMGVVLSAGDKKIYHAGDTGLFLDMKLIGEVCGPLDVAILPIGDNFTMGIDDAVRAAEFLDPALTLPMHFDTFPPIEVDANSWLSKMSAGGRDAKILNPGESIDL
ncbi:MAG: metal-dependent hydrolase [Acidobacteriota bacterium]|nr:metal-dependent hydrolase [Acidobacteriota bacterium]MDH3784265.1 metal-dependent hydrolase [Acidobacteriota bacterium]